MRPRRVCRGNWGRHRGGYRTNPGFNEAPACLPGKWRARWRGSTRRRRCFNEAPACLPGKCLDRVVLDRAAVEASMRPRRVCRGNVGEGEDFVAGEEPASMRPRRVCRGNPRGSRTCRPGPTSGFNEAPACLPGKWSGRRGGGSHDVVGFNEAPACLPGKCGGGGPSCLTLWSFNEAPACLPGKWTASAARRSWTGSRFNEAPACLPGKWRGQPHGLIDRPRASMRPRRVCRGNAVAGSAGGVPESHASMRPRRVCRGNGAGPGPNRPPHPRFNEAPACLPGKWRDLFAALGGALQCFNEAPACLPGKCVAGVVGVEAELIASMRPRRVCRGNSHVGRKWIKRVSALQ